MSHRASEERVMGFRHSIRKPFFSVSLCLISLAPWTANAQRQPASAHVNLYFPQIADGQFDGGRWQTSITLVNFNSSEVSASIRLFDDNGGPMNVDFGAGPQAVHTVRIPPSGALTLDARPASVPVRSGWARVYASLPLMGSASFRLWLGERAIQEVTAPPTLPVIDYLSFANRDLGVAIANPNNRVLRVTASLRTKDGSVLGPTQITVPPYGHTAFNVRDRFPQADNSASVLTLSGVDRPADEFLAWTMNADPSGTFSSLPPGSVTPPVSHWDRIWNVYLRVLDAARTLELFPADPQLKILYDRTVNAYAAGGREVGVYVGLSELLADSDSELAYAIGHELAHIYQQQTGRYELHSNPEFDADMLGTILALMAGYDAYAASGALAKLAMATGTAGLSTQFEQQLSSDAHKSFNTRIEQVYLMLQVVCSLPEVAPACAIYKSVMHPHLPDSAPLSWDNASLLGYRRPDSLKRLSRTGQPATLQQPERELRN